MKLERFADTADFYERAKPQLLGREACHSLILGIAGQLIDHPELFRRKSRTSRRSKKERRSSLPPS
jgi:hypothetical protein